MADSAAVPAARSAPFRGRVAAAAALSASLAGCGTVASSLPPIETAPPVVEAPVQAAADLYRIRIGDVLDIKFPLNPELNDEVTIGPDGRLSTYDAENVPVAGRPASEVSADLRTWYKKILKEPRLAVVVKKYAPAPVFVGGEVVSPGEFPSDGLPLTLSQSVARAGGLKLSAAPANVFVIRRGPDDKPMVFATRYDRVIRGDVASDVRLAPYDLVYVPRTSVSEAFVYFNQYVQQFLPVSWGFSYQINDAAGAYPSPAAAK